VQDRDAAHAFAMKAREQQANPAAGRRLFKKTYPARRRGWLT
jgi:hypothetical protein